MTERPPWRESRVGGLRLELLDLDHPEVEEAILGEMSTGFAVYYDRRWSVTRRFCEILLRNPELLGGLRVAVVGAGVGAEAVVAGLQGAELHLNDRSEVALQMNRRQLERNGVPPGAIHLHPGDMETVDLPPVDRVVACYVVYDDASRNALARLLERVPVPALLANGEFPHFRRLLAGLGRPVRFLGEAEDPPCVLVEGGAAPDAGAGLPRT